MKRIAAGKFKTHCLELMDQVRDRREPILITKNGVPVAKLVPVGAARSKIFGGGRGTIRFLGDVVAPVASEEDWDALT